MTDRSAGNQSPTVRASPAVVAERFGSETIVLDPEANRYVRLNSTGSRLWAVVEEGASVSQLVAVLVDEWGVPSGRAEADVEAFLAAIESKGLVDRTRQ